MQLAERDSWSSKLVKLAASGVPTANTRRTNLQLTTEIYKKPHANAVGTGMQVVCFQHNGDGTPFARGIFGMYSIVASSAGTATLLRVAEVKAIVAGGSTLGIASPLPSESACLLAADTCRYLLCLE